MSKNAKYILVGLVVVGGLAAGYYFYKRPKQTETEVDEHFGEDAVFSRKLDEERKLRSGEYGDIYLPDDHDEEEEAELRSRFQNANNLGPDWHRELDEMESEADLDLSPNESVQTPVELDADRLVWYAEDGGVTIFYNSAEEEEPMFEADSVEELRYYRESALMEIESPDERLLMERLFEIPLKTFNTNDDDLFDELVAIRKTYMKDGSQQVHNPSFAELLLYFAEVSDFDLDGGVEAYVSSFLTNLSLYPGVGQVTMEETVGLVMQHNFAGVRGFGIFALDVDEYNDLILNYGKHGKPISNKNDITYFSEYNVWVKGMMELLQDEDDDIYEDDNEPFEIDDEEEYGE